MTSKDFLDFSDFEEKVALIRISKLYRDDMSDLELYECTRGYWKRTIESISDVKIALAIFDGVVKEVYAVDSWHKAGFLSMQTMPTQYFDDRVEFVGKVAGQNIRNKYKGKSTSGLYQKGEANPIKVLGPEVAHSVIIDTDNGVEYKYVVDILNSIFSTQYKAWMKATWPSNRPDGNFRVWFPQLALTDTNGNLKAATFECVNTISDDQETIKYIDLKEEKRCDIDAYEGYDLIFAKEPKGNYIFRGVYVLDKATLNPHGYSSRRVAKKVKIIGKPAYRIEIISDINFPMKPKFIENNKGLIKVVCNNCDYKFTKAKRCPICGQLIKYDGE